MKLQVKIIKSKLVSLRDEKKVITDISKILQEPDSLSIT